MKLHIMLLTAIGLCLSLPASAGNETVMYKKVDKDGKIIFTDKPIPGSKAVKIKTDTNVVETPKVKVRSRLKKEKEEQSEDFAYEVLSIDTPKNDQSIRANDGNINIIGGITPQLQAGHSLQLTLDGNAGSAQKLPYFNLDNVDRGTHTAVLNVIDDESNEVIQSSDPVTFHVLRTSRLNNRNRRQH